MGTKDMKAENKKEDISKKPVTEVEKPKVKKLAEIEQEPAKKKED
jgi:hypothetical protein